MINVVVADDFIESGTLAEERCSAVIFYLIDLNEALLQVQASIKAAQPVADGAVCLELYKCGPFCIGCPHPRWVKYRWAKPIGARPARLLCVNLDAKRINPAQAIAKSGPARKALLPLIRQAKALIAERTALSKVLRALSPFARPRR